MREELFVPAFTYAELKIGILVENALTRSNTVTSCQFNFVFVSNNVTVVPPHFRISFSHFTFAITTGAENNEYFHG
jgi:hypothetical protein